MSMLTQEATDAGPVSAKPEHIAAGSSSPESQPTADQHVAVAQRGA
jgi:hypothetical protein